MLIRVISIPFPESQEPPFVKDAYVGLFLNAARKVVFAERYPQGLYLVPLSEFITKLKADNSSAYAWFAKQWGELSEDIGSEGYTIHLAFPTMCCEECASDSIQ